MTSWPSSLSPPGLRPCFVGMVTATQFSSFQANPSPILPTLGEPGHVYPHSVQCSPSSGAWARSQNRISPLEALGAYLVTNFLAVIWSGAPFAVSLLAILGAHEFGHYLMGRRHGVMSPCHISSFPAAAIRYDGRGYQHERAAQKPAPAARHWPGQDLWRVIVAIPILLLGLSLSTLDPSQPKSRSEWPSSSKATPSFTSC